MSVVSKAVNLMFSEGDKKRDEGLTTPDNIYRYNNLFYGDDEVYQSLDIYTLKEFKDYQQPTIVNVHGGGFVYGTKESYQYYCMDLAQRGFKVVNFSYRLAPDYKFPIQLEDTNAVFNWLVQNYSDYNLDLDNLYGIGDSAGANILGMYAGLLSKPSLNEKYDHNLNLPDLNLKAIALNCGLYNPAKQSIIQDGSLTSHLMKELFVHKGNLKELDLINVKNYVSENYPPSFIMTSNDDFLREQPEYLMKYLRKKDVPFIYRFFASKTKHLEHVFHLNIKLKESQICANEECNFFKTL